MGGSRLQRVPWLRAVLMEILETSSFKLVADIEASGDYDEAAKKYLAFVDEFPKSDLSDKAMVNAPEPVPASMTTLPGRMSAQTRIAPLSFG